MSRKSRGDFRRALICTTRSCSVERRLPRGSSWFSLRSAADTCSVLTPSASMAVGLSWMAIWRCTPPTTVTAPTPRTFSSFFCSTWVAQVVSSCGDVGVPAAPLAPRSWASTATLKMGWAEGSKREMRASLTSSRSKGLISETFSRTSSAALRPSTSRLNSTMTTATPSYERDDRALIPAMVLTASSIFLVTSASTISGLAPG